MLSIFACVSGSHTVAAYSMMGSTRVLYAVSLIPRELIFRFLLRKPRVLLAFEQTLLMCSFQLRSLVKHSSRQFTLLTVCNMCPRSWYWGWGRPFLLWVTGSVVHFSGWKTMSHLFSHSASWSRFCCRRSWSSGDSTTSYTAVSSVNSLAWAVSRSGTSLM